MNHEDFVVNPLCAERNPALDDYTPQCCRFPKSCSPLMRVQAEPED